MKIDVALPAAFERKWSRLRTYLEDDQILALAAVDLLWDRHGDDVRRAERLNAAHEKRLRECKRRLDGLCTRKMSESPSVLTPVFVGRFRRRVDSAGRLALPAAWMDSLGRPNVVCICRDREKGEVRLLSEFDVRSVSRNVATVVRRPVDEKGRFELPLCWFGKSPVDGVVLSGRLRYAVVRLKRSIS